MNNFTANKIPYFKAPFRVSSKEALILEIIAERTSWSKADLVTFSGLPYSSVTNAINTLVNKGIVAKFPNSDYTGGRRSALFGLNAGEGLLIGADIGMTSIDLVITDFSGEPLARYSESALVSRGPTKILGRVISLIVDLLAAKQLTSKKILGLGLGLPGPVDFSSGTAVSPPIMPGWDKFPIVQFMGEHLPGVMVIVDNDVNIMGIGEHRAGMGLGVDNFIFVKIGTGIGAAIFIDGKIYRGADGCAGDIGHICVDKLGPICNCGNVGCLESVAGGGALADQARQAAEEGKSKILKKYYDKKNGQLQAEDVGNAAKEGDMFSVELIKQTGRRIGEVLAGLVNFANPNMIIIGGGVSNFGDLLLSNIRQAILERSLPLATNRLSIVLSSIPKDAGVIGAINLVQRYSFISTAS